MVRLNILGGVITRISSAEAENRVFSVNQILRSLTDVGVELCLRGRGFIVRVGSRILRSWAGGCIRRVRDRLRFSSIFVTIAEQFSKKVGI